MLRYLAGASVLVLAACSGLSPQACLATDWHALGYADGTAGRDNFARYHADCADHGITANFPAYQAGNTQGVAVYCRPANGYRVGTQGRGYNGICPAALEPGFLAANADGLVLFSLRADLRQIGRDLDLSEDRAAEIEHLIADVTARLATPDLLAAERARLAIDLTRLARERGDVEVAIHDLQAAYEAAEVEVADYHGRTARRYGG